MGRWDCGSSFLTKVMAAGSLFAAGLVGAGCTGTGRSAIPSAAEEIGSGNGLVTTTAPNTGEVWVLDKTDNALVWSGRAVRGDKIVVDPKADKVIVGGENKADRDLSSDHRYGVFQER